MLPLTRLVPLLPLLPLLAGCSSASAPPKPKGRPVVSAAPTAPTLAAPLSRSYAALGASETFGVGAVPYHRGYAYLLARALHAHHFVDLGIPGTTLPAAYDTELVRALSIRPELCTVFFGVNDLRAGIPRASFLADLRDLVTTLRRARAQVIIIGVPTLSLIPAVASLNIGNVDAITVSWNAGMRRVARETGAHFFDLTRFDRELSRHPNYVAPDGLHPSTAGHARLAQLLAHYIYTHHLWR